VCEEGDTSEIDVASEIDVPVVITLEAFNMEQHRGVQEHHRPVV
jgi:hypothetical protein